MGIQSPRSREEIDEQLERTVDPIDSGRSTVPGMSYEQGVDYALRWVTGDSDDAPMED